MKDPLDNVIPPSLKRLYNTPVSRAAAQMSLGPQACNNTFMSINSVIPKELKLHTRTLDLITADAKKLTDLIPSVARKLTAAFNADDSVASLGRLSMVGAIACGSMESRVGQPLAGALSSALAQPSTSLPMAGALSRTLMQPPTSLSMAGAVSSTLMQPSTSLSMAGAVSSTLMQPSTSLPMAGALPSTFMQSSNSLSMARVLSQGSTPLSLGVRMAELSVSSIKMPIAGATKLTGLLKGTSAITSHLKASQQVTLSGAVQAYLVKQQDALSSNLFALQREHLKAFDMLLERTESVDMETCSTQVESLSKTIEQVGEENTGAAFWTALLKKQLTKENIGFVLTVLGFMLTVYQFFAPINAARIVTKEYSKAAVNNTVIGTVRNTKKELVLKAKKTYCQEHLRHCRFISKNKLNVYSAPNKKYDVIESLGFGSAVIVMDRDDSRSWSYVEYYDSNSASYQYGWVFSRYLDRYITYPYSNR